METFLDNMANESRELRMEDTLPSIQIGLMGILAVYGFVTLFFRLTGASSRSGGDDLFNIFHFHDYFSKSGLSSLNLKIKFSNIFQSIFNSGPIAVIV